MVGARLLLRAAMVRIRAAALGLAAYACILLVTSPVVAQEEVAGAAECRCIDPWSAMLPDDTRTCRDLSVQRQNDWGIDNATLACVPLNYGTFCASHDNASHHPACLTAEGQVVDSGQPEWCTGRWCYVNASTCTRPHSLADTAASASDTRAELYHSYETCGNLNAYTDARHYSYLRGRHLRVSYPGDSGSGYTLLTNADGSKSGSVVQFMRSIAKDAGFVSTQSNPTTA